MKSGWTIVWAILLVLGGLFLLTQDVLGIQVSGPMWSALLVVSGLMFLLNFGAARDQWWMLIPGCLLLGMGAVIYLGDRGILPGAWMAALIMVVIGVPFGLIYVTQTARGQKGFGWALIPAGVFALLAVFLALAERVKGEAAASMLMGLIALPFLVVYLANRRGNWWALIPGGALVVAGATILLVSNFRSPNIVGGGVFVGMSAVFGLVYLSDRSTLATRWARYPAALLLAAGIGALILGQNWWPVVLIVAGVALLVRLGWRRAGR